MLMLQSGSVAEDVQLLEGLTAALILPTLPAVLLGCATQKWIHVPELGANQAPKERKTIAHGVSRGKRIRFLPAPERGGRGLPEGSYAPFRGWNVSGSFPTAHAVGCPLTPSGLEPCVPIRSDTGEFLGIQRIPPLPCRTPVLLSLGREVAG